MNLNTQRKLAAAGVSPYVLQIKGSAADMQGWKFKNLGPPMRLASGTAVYVTAGGGGFTVRKKAATATTAIGSATAMTAQVDNDAPAEVTYNFVLSATAADRVLATGDVLGISGTMTSLAGGHIELRFTPA